MVTLNSGFFCLSTSECKVTVCATTSIFVPPLPLPEGMFM